MNVEQLSLAEIKQIRDNNLRRDLELFYDEQLKNMGENRIYCQIIINNYGQSIMQIYEKIMKATLTNVSQSLFPHHIIQLYPQINIRKATKEFTCQLSGGIIRIGGEYLVYRPILEDLHSHNRYVLKHSIISETGYYSFFPRDISEFEQLDCNLRNQFESPDGYNYLQLSKTIGEGLALQKLGYKRPKVK